MEGHAGQVLTSWAGDRSGLIAGTSWQQAIQFLDMRPIKEVSLYAKMCISVSYPTLVLQHKAIIGLPLLTLCAAYQWLKYSSLTF